MKKTIIAIIIIIITGLGAYFLLKDSSEKVTLEENNEETAEMNEGANQTQEEVENETKTVIGKSTEGRDITAYHYFQTETKDQIDTELLFVGGIHGGYSWNTALVAYEMMDYMESNNNSIPKNVKVTIIPALNPDGLNKAVGKDGVFTKSDVKVSEAESIPGRFNGNNVDLNRNFDCDWQTEGVWQNKTVSGGSSAFSEPESQAVKNYIESHNPKAVLVWYSSAGGVFASSCHDGVLAETETLTSLYAKASGYKEYKSFNFYEITGDMVNWLAKKKIPAISVLLTTHTDTEWNKNQKGIDAFIQHYAK